MENLRGYDRYLAHVDSMVKKINLHLPKNRKTLCQLLIEDEPSVDTLDGTKLCFKKPDIDRVARMVPERYHDSFMLPIVVVRRVKLGKGVFIILGGKAERFLVKKILGLTEKSFDDLEPEKADFYLYNLQVQELLSKLKSAVTVGFEVPEDV